MRYIEEMTVRVPDGLADFFSRFKRAITSSFDLDLPPMLYTVEKEVIKIHALEDHTAMEEARAYIVRHKVKVFFGTALMSVNDQPECVMFHGTDTHIAQVAFVRALPGETGPDEIVRAEDDEMYRHHLDVKATLEKVLYMDMSPTLH